MTLPNYLVITPPKCASTWIYLCLKEHPEVYVPPLKELHFFDNNYRHGLDWYKRYFISCKGQKAVAEVSTGYFRSPEAPLRIQKDLGKVRFITCLRNPIDRAYSRYKHHYRKRAISCDFGTALTRLPELLIDRGLYFGPLKRYVGLFGLENILVLIFEELQEDSPTQLRQIYRFLGVDENFTPNIVAQKVVTEEWYNPAHSSFRKIFGKISGFLRRNPQWGRLADQVEKSRLFPAVDSFFARFGHSSKRPNVSPVQNVPPMKPEDRAYLREKYYPEIEALERLLDVDLSSWRKKEALKVKNNHHEEQIL